MAAFDLPAFDPGIIERYVENTYRKATAVFLGSVVAGVMIGTAFGAMPLTSLGASWPIPRMFGFATMMLGAILGGLVGYLIGDTRAFLARLHGQTALAQIEAAKDARLALETVLQIQALAVRRAAAARPQTHAQPETQPPAPAAVASTPVALAPPPPPIVAPAPAPVEALPDPAPADAPGPAQLEVVPPAPPTLALATASPEPAPPLTPPPSS